MRFFTGVCALRRLTGGSPMAKDPGHACHVLGARDPGEAFAGAQNR
ncbi:hypothetical protein SLNWT_4466 [Streptomyces albus]|uniref:Uncharacterized protein n=1 Tax=Streptomyces albus (strain ATCC 21838 / DSM 41398 / FERM P-419 / JCM 4703 / NBRC 107858) TaxID=1081613 RepID=A0A0B5F3J0_STRA4|nr:hypothetical protein SLNWT_4466 [Streptomyces albus]AOU79148.1 hypothetical protein SLNHY_4457 [Streptomyces albus]